MFPVAKVQLLPIPPWLPRYLSNVSTPIFDAVLASSLAYESSGHPDGADVGKGCVSTVATSRVTKSTLPGGRPMSEAIQRSVLSIGQSRVRTDGPDSHSDFSTRRTNPSSFNARIRGRSSGLRFTGGQLEVDHRPAQQLTERLDPALPIIVSIPLLGCPLRGCRMHKKGITEEVAKKRSRKNVKVQVSSVRLERTAA